jgi:hypothetical protein
MSRALKIIENLLSQSAATEHRPKCPCVTCHNKRVQAGTQEEYLRQLRETSRLVCESLAPPKPGVIQSVSQIEENLVKVAQNVKDARKMKGGDTEAGFIKNLFQEIQNVNYDDRCSHTLPYYACMSCSH